MVAESLQTAMLPRASADARGRPEAIARTARLCLLATVPAVVLCFVLARPVIWLMLSPRFLPVVTAYQVLLVGVLIRVVPKVLSAYFNAVDRPGINSMSSAVVLAVNVPLMAFLFPRMGLPGVALSTTVAYSVEAVILATAFSRLSALPFRSTFVPTPADLRVALSVLGRFLLRGRPKGQDGDGGGRKRPVVCFLIGGREGGGSARCIEDMVGGIDREVFDVRVAACEKGSLADRIEQAGVAVDDLGIGWPPAMRKASGQAARAAPVGYLRLGWWVVRRSVTFGRYLKREGGDLVHTNYAYFHLLGAVGCMLAGRRCVFHWHGPVGLAASESKLIPAHKRDRRWRMVRRLAGWIGPMTEGWAWSIANSETTARDVRMIVGDRCTVVYNGVELPERVEPTGRLRRLMEVDKSARIVGMVATMTLLKGHAVLVEAAKRVCSSHRDVHFVCVGGTTAAGQVEYERSVHDLARRLGLAERVHFLGNQPEAAELIPEMEVLCVCTLPPGEGFGLVIVEAMGRCVPVIATDVGAAAEIIENDVSGLLIEPGDADALAAAIEALLGDDDRRVRLGSEGRRRCEEAFSMGAMIEGVQGVYEHLLKAAEDEMTSKAGSAGVAADGAADGADKPVGQGGASAGRGATAGGALRR